MKKLIALLIPIALCVVGMAQVKVEYIPLIGDFHDSCVFYSDQSFDQIWNNLLGYLGAKKIGCPVIDKKNGIIVTHRIDFKKFFSFDKMDGTLIKPDAYIALARIRKRGTAYNVSEPFRFFLKLHITLTKQEPGTKIIIKLLPYYINYGCFKIRPENPEDMSKKFRDIYKSTCIYEQNLFDQIQ